MLLNADGQVWVGRRIDNTDEAWQMPQGGIDKGEEPWATALRELEEETGIPPDLVERIADMPGAAAIRPARRSFAASCGAASGRARCRTGICARFLGDDSDVNIATKHPEFSDWKWVEPDRASRPDRPVQARPVPAACCGEFSGVSLSRRARRCSAVK